MTKRKRKNENPLSDPLAPPVERQYYTVGFVCQMLQKGPDDIHRMMLAAEVEFAWTENGIGVIRGDDLVKMKQVYCEVRSACEAAPNN